MLSTLPIKSVLDQSFRLSLSGAGKGPNLTVDTNKQVHWS
jgi:hypothetical protein